MLLLVAPAASVLILFQIVPIFIGADASFRDWKLYDPQMTWIGWEHYVYVLTDPVFMGLVMPNTLLFMVLSVAISSDSGSFRPSFFCRSWWRRSSPRP